MTRDGLLVEGMEIQAIATSFFVALDRFDDDRVIELFTDDVEWVRGLGVVRGHAEARRVLADRSRSRVTRHLISNIDWSERKSGIVAVRYDVLVFDHAFEATPALPVPSSGAALILTGDDIFVRRQDRWQIARKEAVPLFRFSH